MDASTSLIRYDAARMALAECGLVYFVQRPSTGAVKIGHSRDPLRRVRQLQTCNDETLRFLGLMSGGRGMERLIHQRLARTRLSGEWFSWSNELACLIVGVTTPKAALLRLADMAA